VTEEHDDRTTLEGSADEVARRMVLGNVRVRRRDSASRSPSSPVERALERISDVNPTTS
jgi:hypothetical protein